MSVDNDNATETCPRCLLEVLLSHPHHTDEYEDVWHTDCFENAEQGKAERGFERSLSGDDGPTGAAYRAEMKDAGREHLL